MIAQTAWKMIHSGNTCSACQRPFVDQEMIASAVREGEGALELERFDFCQACWDEQQDTSAYYSHWKRQFISPPEKEKPIKINTRVLLDIFERLDDPDQQGAQHLQYMLGLLLVRRKIMKLSLPEPGHIAFAPHNADGQMHTLEEPAMTGEELEQLKTSLAKLLHGIF